MLGNVLLSRCFIFLNPPDLLFGQNHLNHSIEGGDRQTDRFLGGNGLVFGGRLVGQPTGRDLIMKSGASRVFNDTPDFGLCRPAPYYGNFLAV